MRSIYVVIGARVDLAALSRPAPSDSRGSHPGAIIVKHACAGGPRALNRIAIRVRHDARGYVGLIFATSARDLVVNGEQIVDRGVLRRWSSLSR